MWNEVKSGNAAAATLSFAAKVPGQTFQVRTVRLDFSYRETFAEAAPDAYERVIHDALVGDATLFIRSDEVQQSWRIVQPLLDNPGKIHRYEPGSWGPDAARELLRGHRGWQQPWLVDNHH